jgi:TonB-dependent Receptor Plug Domain.
VVVLDQIRAGQRNMNSTSDGLFLFDSLPPSTYLLTIEAPGFKKWEKKDLKVYPSDRVGVNDIVLEIGQVTETVTVEASVAALQTESAKVDGTVTSQQVTELSSYSRNFLNMLRTIPGVTVNSANDFGGSLFINGQRSDQVTFKLDGMLNMDMGDNSCCSSMPNLDMIEEMKVVTNGATADMGTVGSSQVMVVTKSGSKEFHGNVYYFRRHESMNANSWTNNITGNQRGRDRMNQGGLTLGGPLFIPKLFNTKKEKLFFFVSSELWKNLTPSLTTRTVPTQAERNGDFTQSIRMDTKATVQLLDPTVFLPNGSRAPLAGNILPVQLRNPDAQKLMNIMPLPNLTDLTGIQYNYSRQNSSGYRDYLSKAYKIDYNYNERWRFYGRFSQEYNEVGNPLGDGSFEIDSAGKTMGWTVDWRTAWNLVLNTTTIINPTTTNEFILGGAKNAKHQVMDKVTYTRSNLNLAYGLPDLSVVRDDAAPRISLSGGGLSNAPSLGTAYPYIAINPDYQFTDNFTKVMARHTFKAGGTYQIDRKDQDPWGGTTHNGQFQFNADAANPGDYDYQFATLLGGGFNTFAQIKKVIEGRFIFHQGEWWVMDTWKVKPNLTLDLGLRFSVLQPTYDSKGQQATFSKDLWNPAKVVKLYGYASNNRAVDPTTGFFYPSFMRGQIVPGSGDIDNGFSFVGKNGIPAHLIPYAGIQYSPRIGIAWQPKFLPKTVIRIGGGMFKDRLQGNVGMGAVGGPPTTRTISLRYGNMRDINAALYTMISPQGGNPSGYAGSGKIPKTINWNFAVERELPGATLLTVSYVGSISRHLIYANWINEPYYGSAWTAAAQDPTRTPLYNGTTTLPINFYRPYIGVSQLTLYGNGGSANYNALQIQVQKRMSRKLSYGVAYTWSKTLGIGNDQWTWVNPFDRRKYNYGRTGYDRTQVLVANFVYYLPRFGKNGNFLDIPGVRLALNDWQLSGIVTAQTGSPTQFNYPGFNTDGSNIALRWTGQEQNGPRPYILPNWRLPSSQMDEYHQFNTNAVLPALIPSVGLESGIAYWSNPATFLSSPEITLMKNVQFSKDGRRFVQLRLETYNMLNHHDYTGRGMGPTYNSPVDLTIRNLPTGISTLVNPSNGTSIDGGRFGYGALSGAASPRRVQISIKINF